MGTSNLTSAFLTSRNATPAVALTRGEGSSGHLKVQTDFIDAVSADDTSSTYRLCRLSTKAKVKAVYLSSKVVSAGAADVNIAYSNDPEDGTPAHLAGDIVQITGPADNKLFGAAQSLVLSGVRTDFTHKNTLFGAAEKEKPLWEVLGLMRDPGGYFDFLLAVTTTITTGGRIGIEAHYVL